MELVYRLAAVLTRTFSLLCGHKRIRVGDDHIPPGGAVIAMNHISYIDFLYAGLAIKNSDKRYVRFMAKIELRENPVLRFAIWSCKAISVDRSLGRDAYLAAVHELRRGQLVGVFAEATISRSFELKTFKSGAARMALEAGVPIVPVIVWGSQRIATKGQPLALGRTHTPVAVGIGAAIQPEGDAASLTSRLHEEMSALLRRTQAAYAEHPHGEHAAGEFWVPAAMGGSAPTLAEADALDLAEKEEKERIRAELRAKRGRS